MSYSYGYKDNNNNVNAETKKGSSAKQVSYSADPNASKTAGWVKAVVIILAIAVGLALMSFSCSMSLKNLGSNVSQNVSGIEYLLNGGLTTYGRVPEDEDYIATIFIDGSITEDNSATYNHKFVLNTIDSLINDEHNLGLVLWTDTPGGTVFASDEVYLKLKDYKKQTGRPIYTSMQAMTASGGYYIGCVADRIYANRNCWTGSIGVTMGQMFDVSELLDELGVKVTTITAGKNKAMGSNYVPLTDEQRAVYQSLVDEAYEQFTGIVATERGMDIEVVKKLADGRVYTAKQALDNGLIDEIGTYEDCLGAIKRKARTSSSTPVVEFKTFNATFSLSSLLGEARNNDSKADASYIEELVNLNGKFQVSYMSDLTK